MAQEFNAHRLFDEYKAKKESWWTALFTICAAHLARTQPLKEFKLYRYRQLPSMEWLEDAGDSLAVKSLALSNCFVDSSLRQAFGSLLPKSNLRPDIVYFDRTQNIASLIENKTLLMGGSPDKLVSYCDAAEALKTNGVDTKFILLISQGSPQYLIWNKAQEREVPVLRWEDVLQEIDGIDWLRTMFDRDLKPYYDIRLLREPVESS